MKKNKKSVSVKNTKSFLGNPPALANTTFFVPAANLNANDGIFTDLHDAPSNFSSSNQDPNYTFDLSNKIFAQSGKKKIFSDDKFKNMISYNQESYNQDTYTGDLFSDNFAPTGYPYESIVREVSPVLADIYYPPNLTVEPQPISVGVAPRDADYFAPSDDFVFAASKKAGYTMPTEVENPNYQSDLDLQPVSVGIAPIDANYFAPVDDNYFAIPNVKEASRKLGDLVPREVGDFVPVPMDDYYFSDANVSPIFAAQEVTRYTSGEAYPTEVGDAQIPLKIVAGKVMRENEYLRPEFLTSEMISSYSDEDLLKLIGQEEFDRVVASRYRDGMLISPPPTPEMDVVEVQNVKDPLPDKNNVPTASIQPMTIGEDKKAKKPYNWLPLLLVVAAVGGYMYYNKKN